MTDNLILEYKHKDFECKIIYNSKLVLQKIPLILSKIIIFNKYNERMTQKNTL